MQLAQKVRFIAPRFELGPLQVSSPEFKADVSETRLSGAVNKIENDYFLTRDVIEEFANCRIEVAAVSRFTTRFGPLWADRADKRFAFRLLDWESARWEFRLTWDRLLGLPPREAELGGMREQFKDHLERLSREPICFVDASGGRFELSAEGELVFVAEHLYQALVLMLWALSGSGKLRRCLRPDCDRWPYFIAEHGKQQYCCEQCAEWGQRRWKKAWWNKKGQQWRETRARLGGDKGRREKAKRGTSVVVSQKRKTK